jgi:4-amino-4-deoxy-L-arabinose transferase-like glycosyltransferase
MDRSIPILVLLLALLVRVGAAIGIHLYLERSNRDYLIAGDAQGYWALGRRLATGQSYQVYTPPRRVMRMPGYPLLIAGSLQLWGESRLAVRLTQAVLSTMAVGLLFLLGRELIDSRTGLIASGVLAVSPAVVGFSALILSETLFAVLLLVNLWLAVRWINRRKQRQPDAPNALGAWAWPLLVGVSAGLAVCVRPTWLPAVFVWAALAWLALPRSSAWKAALLVVAGCLVTLLPWAVRNRAATGHWVWTTLWVGPSLYDSLNPEADGSSEMTFFDRENVMAREGLSEYEMDRHYRARAWKFVRTEPGQAVRLMLTHAGRYWSLTPNADQFQNVWLRCGLGAWNLLFFAIGVLGIYALRHQWFTLLICAGPLLAFGVIHTVFVGSLRYRLPAEYPFTLIVAAGIVWLCNSCTAGSSSAPSARGDAE